MAARAARAQLATGAKAKRSLLQLVLAPALAGVLAKQRERLVAEALDRIVEALQFWYRRETGIPLRRLREA
jgi:hypothetical protein